MKILNLEKIVPDEEARKELFEQHMMETTLRLNAPRIIRDLAALITVREYLATRSAPKADAQSVQESADDKKRRDAVVLMTHSADLDTVPTIQQVETALHSISVNTPEERKRVQDAKKWAQIISQKNA